MTATVRYRPEIDGLRAFAVVAVIINHVDHRVLPSGYLGVDMFFVISGFVITSSLSNRPSSGFPGFLAGFYERRIKRLLPALAFFVLITSLVFCLFSENPHQAIQTGIAGLFGFSNMALLRGSTNYFGQSTELNPFTHTWSLGVEEQFYLVFPFLIWFSGYARQTLNGVRRFSFILLTLSIASLLGFVFLYQQNQPLAYFSMPTRFWELAAGSLVCLALQRGVPVFLKSAAISTTLILGSIVIVMFFPLAWAVPATIAVVLLTAVLLYLLSDKCRIYKLLTLKGVLYLGLLSYSLYLSHWCVLSISRWTIGLHWWSLPLLIVLMFGLAVFSYHCIENPLRKRAWFGQRSKTFAAGLVVASLTSTASYGVASIGQHLYLGRPQAEFMQKDGVGLSISDQRCPSGNMFSADQLKKSCTLPTRNGKTIIAIGDSQTWHLLPLLNQLHSQQGYGVQYYASNGTAFPSLHESRIKMSKERHSKLYNQTAKVFDYYFDQTKPGDIILISSRFELRWGQEPIPIQHKEIQFSFYDHQWKQVDKGKAYKLWLEQLSQLSDHAARRGVNIVFLTSLPTFPNELPPSLTNPQWFNKLNRPPKGAFGWPTSSLRENYAAVDSAIKSIAKQRHNVAYIDLTGVLCDSFMCDPSPGLFRDQWHLSERGSISLYDDMNQKLAAFSAKHRIH